MLIVDDSAFMRKMISRMIEEANGLEVVGMARNGREGVEMAQQLRPDLVTLDIEMPELDGLGALRQIRIKCRKDAPAVLMCSSLTTEGSAEALKALRLGAADIIAKDPAVVGKNDEGFRKELITKLKAIGVERARSRRSEDSGPDRSARTPTPIHAPTPEQLHLAEVDAVVVGSSTGGPPVLEDIFSLLPAALRVPIFVAQHMPPVFTKSLAARLDQHCACTVRMISERTEIETPGVFVAEGGRHMHLSRHRTGRVVAEMLDEPTTAVFRPSVDVLFETASRVFGPRVLAVQLTGMGDDGAKGAEILRRAGGRVIAQHESTCVVYGMPRAIVERGLADGVMTPSQIAGLMRNLGALTKPISGDSQDQHSLRHAG
ncbi:MAG: chemotaxis-specific protein-glutamate methyltransferase CheB [Phycisphaerales bacterium]|nr:chemotaxis-specific protein-glutamate methyltransferase CheB [Phycisphaerales bacterium]